MNSGKVDLEWSTSSEISSARFVIERGGGNYAFTEIASMEAAGNKPAQWIYDMLASGAASFYKVEDGAKNIMTFLQNHTK